MSVTELSYCTECSAFISEVLGDRTGTPEVVIKDRCIACRELQPEHEQDKTKVQ